MAILPCSAGVARRCDFYPPKLLAGESLAYPAIWIQEVQYVCPATRDPAAYQLYIKARKVWRSKIDAERERRYDAIYDTLQINPDLKLSRLDQVLPLPPAPLPKWSGVDSAVEPESNGRPTY